MSNVVSHPATCNRCNGTGWVPIPGDGMRVEACNCQGELRRRQRIAAASIPKRYAHCTLSNFRVDPGGKRSPSLSVARDNVQRFVDEWPDTDQGKGLLLMGPCGTGKTHLAVAALLEIINGGKTGHLLFSNFQELIQEIQASFGATDSPGKGEILRPLLDADLLVLDELGSQKPTTFVQDILYYVINTRYNDERATIFTTNYFDEGGKEESLSDRIGARLRSRLYEMAWAIKFLEVTDYRRNTN